jgi:hypothetical protein
MLDPIDAPVLRTVTIRLRKNAWLADAPCLLSYDFLAFLGTAWLWSLRINDLG